MPVGNNGELTTSNSLQDFFQKQVLEKELSNGDKITIRELTTLDLITVKQLINKADIEDEMTQDMLVAGMSLVKLTKKDGSVREYSKVEDLQTLLVRMDVPLGIWTEIVEFSGEVNGLKGNEEQAKK